MKNGEIAGRNAALIIFGIFAAAFASVVTIFYFAWSNNHLIRKSIVGDAYFPSDSSVSQSNRRKAFMKAALILEQKCADCHSPGLLVEPLYFSIPLVNTMLKKDIEEAQKILKIEKDQLAGKRPFTRFQLVMIQNTIDNDNMPPTLYRLMHKDSVLTEDDNRAIIDWIKEEVKEIP